MNYLDHIIEVINIQLNIDVVNQSSEKEDQIDAKKIYCDIARELTSYSFAEIGNKINNGHSNVIHHRNSSKDLRDVNKRYRIKYEKCFNNISKKPKKELLEEAYAYHLQKCRYYKRAINEVSNVTI